MNTKKVTLEELSKILNGDLGNGCQFSQSSVELAQEFVSRIPDWLELPDCIIVDTDGIAELSWRVGKEGQHEIAVQCTSSDWGLKYGGRFELFCIDSLSNSASTEVTSSVEFACGWIKGHLSRIQREMDEQHG